MNQREGFSSVFFITIFYFPIIILFLCFVLTLNSVTIASETEPRARKVIKSCKYITKNNTSQGYTNNDQRLVSL